MLALTNLFVNCAVSCIGRCYSTDNSEILFGCEETNKCKSDQQCREIRKENIVAFKSPSRTNAHYHPESLPKLLRLEKGKIR